MSLNFNIFIYLIKIKYKIILTCSNFKFKKFSLEKNILKNI